MHNPNDFSYTYCPITSRQKESAQRIRRQYLRPEEDAFAQLRRLDERVKRPGTIAALALGTLGSLVFGAGMCLVMVWSRMAAGVAVGIPGMIMAGLAYPLYQRMTERRKRENAPEILRLTDELEQS